MLLLPDSEPFDKLSVPFGVFALQVIQQPSSLPNELEQSAPGVVILGVRLEMFGQVVDTLAEQCDLDFGGAGVFVVGTVRADEIGLLVLR